MMEIRIIINPFGQDWLEKLRQMLPSIERLNISEDRLLIDGNRRALFITGHKTKKTIGHIGMTKITSDGNDLKIQTTTLTPYIFIGVIAPFIFILTTWITGKSISFNTIATLLFIWTPIYYVRDIMKQNKFSEEVRNEIDMLNKKA